MLLFCKTDDSREAIGQAVNLVSERRRIKALRLPTRRARANSLAAELLARRALAEFGLSPELLCFDTKGRPCVRENAAYISLSHSGEYVACAISDRAVGVDVQKIKPVSSRVIRRVCSAQETAALDREDPDRAFTCVWALKEAWRKANPDAGVTEMLRVQFLVAQDGAIAGPPGFSYTLSDEIEGYALAVCEAL